MKPRFLAPILVVLLVAGCASVPMGDEARDNQLKTFVAPKDRAGVYVYRNESIGAAVKMDVEIDGQPIGQTAKRTYLYAEVPPGKHMVTSKAENTETLELDAKPGMLYYIWQEVKMGILFARNKLHLVPEAQGKAGVAETSLAVGR